MTPPATPVQLDHLVLAARTLDEGMAYLAGRTGAEPRRGGRHLAMGTHNALLRLGDGLYLEVIAIDPEGARPARPRWFELDDPDMQASLAERPRLVHWVARTGDVERAAAGCPVALGPVRAMARGDYRWRITIPDDGARPGGGVVPTLIQWDVAGHPADGLPESGVSLAGLSASHPDPAPIRAALAALGVGALLAVAPGPVPRLEALLRTPKGPVTLSS